MLSSLVERLAEKGIITQDGYENRIKQNLKKQWGQLVTETFNSGKNKLLTD